MGPRAAHNSGIAALPVRAHRPHPDRRSLRVHRFHFIRKPCHHGRSLADRYLLRHSTARCARLHPGRDRGRSARVAGCERAIRACVLLPGRAREWLKSPYSPIVTHRTLMKAVRCSNPAQSRQGVHAVVVTMIEVRVAPATFTHKRTKFSECEYTIASRSSRHWHRTRLRAAGVSFEDRQDLQGHKSSRMTTHYSAAEIGNLVAAANRATNSHESPTRTVLRVVAE